MMSEISLRDYVIQMEEWKAMKQLEPGNRQQRPEDIAIINHQFLNVQVENSEVVVTPPLSMMEQLWQAVTWAFSSCLWPDSVSERQI